MKSLRLKYLVKKNIFLYRKYVALDSVTFHEFCYNRIQQKKIFVKQQLVSDCSVSFYPFFRFYSNSKFLDFILFETNFNNVQPRCRASKFGLENTTIIKVWKQHIKPHCWTWAFPLHKFQMVTLNNFVCKSNWIQFSREPRKSIHNAKFTCSWVWRLYQIHNLLLIIQGNWSKNIAHS